jgi:hypothetical protein
VATKPILLRPDCALADAMTRAAEQAGLSRQVWMLRMLEDAVMGAGTWRIEPSDADQPLPGT